MTRFDALSEDDLLTEVMRAATLTGWMWHHVRRSDLAIQQGDPGWPDLFLVHPKKGRIIVAELKSDTGRVSDGQVHWLSAFGVVLSRVLSERDPALVGTGSPILEVYTWRPADMTAILDALQR